MKKECEKSPVLNNNENTQELLNIAKKYSQIDDFNLNKQGFEICNKLSSNNNIDAILLLSTYYRYGIGCNKDLNQAFIELKKAKSLGSLIATDKIKEMKKEKLVRNDKVFAIKLIICVLLMTFVITGIIAFMILMPRREKLMIIKYNSFRGHVFGEGYRDDKIRLVIATPKKDFQFDGWFSNDKLITNLPKMKYITKNNSILEARFSLIENQ